MTLLYVHLNLGVLRQPNGQKISAQLLYIHSRLCKFKTLKSILSKQKSLEILELCFEVTIGVTGGNTLVN